MSKLPVRRSARAAAQAPCRRWSSGLTAVRALRRDLASFGLGEDAQVRNRFPPGAEGIAVHRRAAGGHGSAPGSHRERRHRDARPAGGRAADCRGARRDAGRCESPSPERLRPADREGRRDSGDCAAHRGALQVRDRRGALRAGSRRALRPAVPSDAVHRDVHARSRRRGVFGDGAGAGTLRGESFQRREARRAARRAGVCRDRVAGDVDRAVARDAGQRPRLAQGRARDRGQSRQGRGEGRGRPGAAPGLARDASRPAGVVLARGRGDHGAVPRRRAAFPDARLRRRETRRQRIPDPGDGEGWRLDLRPGLSARGVSAHHATARARLAAGDSQGRGRLREAEPEGRLRHGRG